MYRKNRVLKKMIEEHMTTKNQSPDVKSKPKRYYHHSSMEFNNENADLKNGEVYKNPSQINGNITSLRTSAGNMNTYYSSQTPKSQTNRESSASKMNYSSTPFSSKNRDGTRIGPTNKLSTKQLIDEPVVNESFDDTFMDNSSLSIGDYDQGPTIHQETINRGLNFTNSKLVLSSNLDEFMDRQLQIVAERLADK